MRNMMICGLVAALVCSCASSTPNTTVQSPADEAATKSPKKESDTFDKIGVTVSNSARWTWNATKSAWEWIDSTKHEEEVKAGYHSVQRFFNRTLTCVQDKSCSNWP